MGNSKSVENKDLADPRARGGAAVATCHDVANFILKQRGEMTAMKLQKLVYYSQAWTLVWEERLLFHERIEAWANGPVIPELYERHRGQFLVDGSLYSAGGVQELGEADRTNVGKVLAFYGDKTAQWLSNLTHQERPWLETRKGVPVGEPSQLEIPTALMHEYYSSI